MDEQDDMEAGLPFPYGPLPEFSAPAPELDPPAWLAAMHEHTAFMLWTLETTASVNVRALLMVMDAHDPHLHAVELACEREGTSFYDQDVAEQELEEDDDA